MHDIINSKTSENLQDIFQNIFRTMMYQEHIIVTKSIERVYYPVINDCVK